MSLEGFFLQWFCNKDINFFGLNVGKCGNLVVDTMSYRRTKICLMLSWDVLVGMLPMRHGRSNSLRKLQFMACCSCGDFTTIKISSTNKGGPECFWATLAINKDFLLGGKHRALPDDADHEVPGAVAAICFQDL